MKKKFYLAVVFFSFTTFLSAQLKVTSTGNVGIGTSTPNATYKTTINGTGLRIQEATLTANAINIQTYNETCGGNCDLHIADISPASYNYYSSVGGNAAWGYGRFVDLNCTYFTNNSDKTLKKNIQSLNFDSKLFTQLNPVNYEFKDSVEITKNDGEKSVLKFKKEAYPTMGFIAQEVQAIYPQMVEKDDKTGLLKIKTLEFIPILVKALQDQQAQIDVLSEIVSKSNTSPKKVAANSTTITETDPLTYPVLDQNVPNPFSMATTIGFYLPTNIAAASIYVYDMNGLQLKNYSVKERGKSNIIIQGSELNAGMYLYALIADGKVIDTKRMILTK